MSFNLVKVGNNFNVNVHSYWADNESDLPNVPTEGVPIHSTLTIASTGVSYYLDENHEWKVFGTPLTFDVRDLI